jgi:hypothetical protein
LNFNDSGAIQRTGPISVNVLNGFIVAIEKGVKNFVYHKKTININQLPVLRNHESEIGTFQNPKKIQENEFGSVINFQSLSHVQYNENVTKREIGISK